MKFPLKEQLNLTVLHLKKKGSTGVVKIIMDEFQENFCNMNLRTAIIIETITKVFVE